MARRNLAHAERDVLFRRNEGGGRLFHRFVETLIGLDDDAPASAFP